MNPRHWRRPFVTALTAALTTLALALLLIPAFSFAVRTGSLPAPLAPLLRSALTTVGLTQTVAATLPFMDTPSETFCAGVTTSERARLQRGLTLMGRTVPGQRLRDVLTRHDICIGTAPITFNGGYARAERALFGGWSDSKIVLDQLLVAEVEFDILAAMLVHEATHIERAIAGTSCGISHDCETLPNGVELEEEIAAHTAEAEWWIDVHGPTGKRTLSLPALAQNRLAASFQESPEAFAALVRDLRNDPREGEGIT
ncbi:MAG: hypothetical protein M3R06_11475 [Chloroflexota bacterium]|nr:hypothetical protein [Chloroflexota bacterium]